MGAHRINGTVTRNVGSVEYNAAVDTFIRRINAFYKLHRASGDQREGQAWMNALGDADRDLYDLISQTDADCFYDDGKIAAFKREVFGG